MGERAFSYRRGEEVAEAFARHGVEYVFIGKAGAVFHGFPDTTQDVDIFPAKSRENGARIVAAMRDLGFPVASLEDIIRSKRAANRPRDRETLPRLEAFAEYLRRGGRPSP